MFRKILSIFGIFILLNYSFSGGFNWAFAKNSNYNPKIVVWNSEDGITRLGSSEFKNDFYQLANFYQAQINPLLCSSATALIIKNALFYDQIPSQKTSEIIKPDGDVVPYNLYSSQEEFFNEETDKIKDREVIKYRKKHLVNNQEGKKESAFDPGLNLQDFAKILKKHQIKNKIYYQNSLDEKSISNLREVLKKVLNDKTHFIIANFNGKIFGNKTGGHFSPLVAYDENSDSILVLDVALYKNQWYWVGVNDMAKAMNDFDGAKPRGYLVVWR